MHTHDLTGRAVHGGAHGGGAAGVGFLGIGDGGDVCRTALQDVQLHGAHLAADLFTHDILQAFADTGQVFVAEIIDRAGLIGGGIGDLDTFGHGDDHGAAVLLHAAHVLHEPFGREGDLRQIDQLRRGLAAQARQRCGGGQPAGVAPHDLHDQDGIKIVHRAVADDLRHRGGDELRRRAVARRVIHARQIVIDGLRHADDPNGTADCGEIGGQLFHRVHRIVAADVKERADIMRLQRAADLFVRMRVFFGRGQLVPAGAQGGGWRLDQQSALLRISQPVGQIDQPVAQHALDAVGGAENALYAFADGLLVHAEQRGIDHTGRAAGLGNGDVHQKTPFTMTARQFSRRA